MVVGDRQRRRGRSARCRPRSAAARAVARAGARQPAQARDHLRRAAATATASASSRRPLASALIRERHLDASLLAQQRHRLELQPVVVHGAPGARQEERRARSSGSAARRRRASPSCSGAAAAARTRRGTRAACPSTLATTSVAPATRPPQRALAGSRRRVDLEPCRRHHDRQLRTRCRSAIGSARPAHLRRDPLDLETLEVGCGLLERLLDRELERDRRGRAVRAAPLQPDPGDAVFERRAARRCRRGSPCTGAPSRARPARAPRAAPDAGRGSAAASRPAGRRRAPAASLAPSGPMRASPRGSAPGRSPYICTTRRHELLGQIARGRVARSRPAAPAAPGRARAARPTRRVVAAASITAVRPAPWACASPCAPCRCRCTCARRTAGTGRTSGPPA